MATTRLEQWWIFLVAHVFLSAGAPLIRLPRGREAKIIG